MNRSIAHQFEDCVRRILEAAGFEIQLVGGDGHDFKATFSGNLWRVEVKFYRTKTAQFSLLEAAAARLSRPSLMETDSKAMLVVSCEVTEEIKAQLGTRFGVLIIDRGFLVALCQKHPRLLEELQGLIEEGSLASAPATRLVMPVFVAPPRGRDVDSEPPAMRGSALERRISEIPVGKDGWRDFESTSVQIIEYLFQGDLWNGTEQCRTDDGLNKFDYICRVSSDRRFWQFVVHQLSSPYVLFEFKNYREPIGQGEVLTTEKYLFERGFRKLAIIFTRARESAAAASMARGAMREHGKLILILDESEICTMLRMKDGGEDPSDYLFDAADRFFIGLSR